METNNQSPFIRGIAKRLSTIFGEDIKQPDHTKVPDTHLEENGSVKKVSIEAEMSHVHQDDSKNNIEVSESIQSAKSPFVRGIENRLDSIFETGDKQPGHSEVSDTYVNKDDYLKKVIIEPDMTRIQQDDGKKGFIIDEALESTQSQIVQGIENRIDAIFGAEISGLHHLEGNDPLKEITIETNISGMHQDDGKTDDIDVAISVTKEPSVGHEIENHLSIVKDSTMSDHTEEAVIHNPSEHESLKEISATKVPDEKDDKVERFEKLFEELSTSTSIWYSPLKDLKSTVLSIEWEISDQIMVKFDKEVSKISNLFAEDKIILGFLRILRFLGRYIKAKGIEAHFVSVKLLLSIYDDLERVLLTRDMAETKKHAILLEDIKKYREWVEAVDLVIREEDRQDGEEMPPADAKKTIYEIDREDVITAPSILSRIQETTGEDTIPPSKEKKGASFAVTEEITPHEAFACALDEIKKVISAEFSALRAELKLWRQGQ